MWVSLAVNGCSTGGHPSEGRTEGAVETLARVDTAPPAVKSASSETSTAGPGSADRSQQLAAPIGSILVPGHSIAARVCDLPKACPLFKLAAARHSCETLAKHQGKAWRLPTRTEAQSFGAVGRAEDGQAYHWTSTPFVEDPQQMWIVMPQRPEVATTYRGEQKAFITRCVVDLAAK